MTSEIQQRALDLGFDDCRFTSAEAPGTADFFKQWLALGFHGEMGYLQRQSERRANPRQVLPGAQSVIVLSTSYHQASPIAPNPTAAESAFVWNADEPGYPSGFSGVVARYARYSDYHNVLAAPLKELSEFINQLGGPDTRSLWYVDTGPVMERDLAQRSGLGFIGKHTNLISRRSGNWILLSEILTTLELEPDRLEHNRCGSCTRCLEACPTSAITAPFQLDARRCISYLTIELKGPIPTELRPAIGNRIFGCDDCLAVCPWNRFAKEGRLMQSHGRRDLLGPDLLHFLKLDELDFKRRFVGTPLLRTKRKGLLRNVCVALGNTGDESVVPALERAASDPEPLIAEHARWAIDQIQGRKARNGVVTASSKP